LPGDRVPRGVEDDPPYARVLLEAAHANGFKAVIESRGATAAVLARELAPDAITLDISLPDIDGWRVLRRLKEDVGTRHIPIHVISTHRDLEPGLRRGARAVLEKPADVAPSQAALDDLRRLIDLPAQDVLLALAAEAG